MRGPDVEPTTSAANRQLEACTSSECLRRAYAQWRDYVADNYGATERAR